MDTFYAIDNLYNTAAFAQKRGQLRHWLAAGPDKEYMCTGAKASSYFGRLLVSQR